MVLRATAMSALGQTISVPSIVAPRILFVEVGGLFGIMALLSYRFVSSTPNWFDPLCLVGALVAAMYSMISNTPSWLLAAVLFMGIGYAYRRFGFDGHNREDRNASVTRP